MTYVDVRCDGQASEASQPFREIAPRDPYEHRRVVPFRTQRVSSGSCPLARVPTPLARFPCSSKICVPRFSPAIVHPAEPALPQTARQENENPLPTFPTHFPPAPLFHHAFPAILNRGRESDFFTMPLNGLAATSEGGSHGLRTSPMVSLNRGE